MNYTIAFILLLMPSFAYAGNAYQTVISELLHGREEKDQKIAVAGFSYSDGRDSMDGGVVSERVTTELVKLSKFKIIERKEIEKIFEELKLQHSGAINSGSVKEIGKMSGADWVIVGTLTELPSNQLELNARIVGVETGEIISAANTQLKKDWLGRYKELLAIKTKAIEQNPKDATAFYERGLINNDLKDYDAAIANFGLAITIDPIYQDAYYGRAGAYRYKGDNDKAVEDYNKAIQLNPVDWKSYFDRGAAHFYKGALDKAIEDYSSVISINPTLEFAYYNRGQLYAILGEYEKAIPDFSKAIELEPQWPFGSPPRLIRYFHNDTLKETFTWIGLPPKYMRGQAYYRKGESDKAILDFKEIIKSSNANDFGVAPDTGSISMAYYFMGMSERIDSKKFENLSMAIKIDPEFTEAYKERGLLSYMLEWGKTKSHAVSDSIKTNALSDLTKAISIATKDADAYYRRGLIYSFEKEYKKALNDFDMALELNPSLGSDAWLKMNRDMAVRMVGYQDQSEH